jgi:hypothetical protein
MHPSASSLALYAGRDVGLWTRLRLALHVRSCGRCARQVDELQGIRGWLRTQREELPPGVDWDEMAAEMKANIRLGLAAGACISAPAPARRAFHWRPALVLPVLLVVIAGWIIQTVHAPLTAVQVAEFAHPTTDAAGVVLATSAAGIGLEQAGRGFTLLSPRAENVIYSVRGRTAVRARYVDAETGQVTISHVYAQ